MAGIWVSFGNLQDVIGEDMARVLCQTRGGVTIYVPKTARQEHELTRYIGMTGLRSLSAVYGGEVIVVPNYRRGKPRKAEIIRLLERGLSMRDIALQLDVTERYVEHIATSVRPKATQVSLLEM